MKKENSDSEDDYMSEFILSNIKDVKPGIASNIRSHQRTLRIEANRELAKEKFNLPKKKELERNRLEEGLGKPICVKSKGFSLLAKMGYTPGMSLGKKREGQPEGIKEPITIQIKNSKTGLGHETEKLEKQKERCNLHLESMAKRARAETSITADFQIRKRFVVVQKQLISDLQKARKTCEELDIRLGRELPVHDWFWPIFSCKREINNDEDEEDNNDNEMVNKKKTNFLQSKSLKLIENEKECETYFIYSNGKIAPEPPSFYELNEIDLKNCITKIASYVRLTHIYCIWCGCLYTSANDLNENCPGETREDHDDGFGNHYDD